MRRLLVLAFVSCVLVASCGGDDDDDEPAVSGAASPSGMLLSSSAFEAGATIPERYSCEGENLSPPLSWTPAPTGTVELALVLEDPDAPGGTFIHWVVVDIPPTTTSLEAGTVPAGATVLAGSSEKAAYVGPCPPGGDEAHRYHFRILALPASSTLASGADPEDAVKTLLESASAGGELVGTYRR